MSSQSGRRRRGAAILTVALLGLVLAVLPSAPAGADTAPITPGDPETVSSDALPTVQINGIAWDQVIVGNTVYVAGEFTSARPAGSAAGTNETPRANALAYDIRTGELITTWAPSLNAQAISITASADGSTIYLGGSFTQVDGVTRNRLVAVSAATGEVVNGFNPNVNANVNALTVKGSTLYVGGAFTVVSNQPRTRLAAVNAVSGALSTWAPSVDQEVRGITVPGDLGRVIAAGHFELVNGVTTRGMAALSAADASLLPWAVNSVISNGGADSAVWSVSDNGSQVFGTGYTFGAGGNLEGTFAADAATGNLQWVNGCRGDTYDAHPVGNVLYSVGHSHDCGMVGGWPQYPQPWQYQRAAATTTYPDPSGLVNGGTTATTNSRFPGRPAARILHWLPTVALGSYTGQDQGAWSVEGNSDYVVLAGEFPRVNLKDQYGLVRFAAKSKAPNKDAPVGYTELTPKLVAIAPGSVRVSWTRAWDRDNERLTYEVLRGATTSTSTVLATFTRDQSTWWNRPEMSFIDTTAPAGSSQTYRIRVRDPFNNIISSASATITVPAGQVPTPPYAADVNTDAPSRFWRLGESSGTVAYDWASGNDLTLDATATRNVSGSAVNDSSPATTFAGSATVPASTGYWVRAPQVVTTEAWVRTTSTRGGAIVGFGSSRTASSSAVDRVLYMSNTGEIRFGVNNGSVRAVASRAGFNDGQWHHVVGSMGLNGLRLYVDGALVGRDASVTSANDYYGFWRVGGDSLSGWPSRPTSDRLAGTIDDVAVYGTELPIDRVRSHFLASGRASTWPSDTYGLAVFDSTPSPFLRLDETSGNSAADRMGGPAATYAGGYVLGAAPSPANTAGRSVTLNGSAARVVGQNLVSNPQSFTLQTWFRTTNTGGRIIGFGNSRNATSSSYDRHVYMLNDGRLRFGVYTGTTQANIDSTNAYNDGQWHMVAVTHEAGAQRMYVDGVLVASGSAAAAQNYNGYWRLGSDNVWAGSSTRDFRGQIDEAAVYRRVLSQQTIISHWVAAGGTAPNIPPTASFTASASQLTATVDASGSSDLDGTLASYAWNFGDGSTGTGATAQRTYAAAGTYTVTLTVTDNQGATATTTRQVTVTAPPPNQAPTASFTSSSLDLTASVDASGSSDPDGTVASYAWDFGDGSTGTGVTAQRTYAAAGTYTVTLTVTDNQGATATTSTQVTVTNPPADLANDSFSRTVTGGLGTADVGGAWTVSGNAANYSVNGSQALLNATAAGSLRTAYLNAVQQSDVDLSATVALSQAATGGGTYVSLVGRNTAGGDYRLRLRFLPDGSVTVYISRFVSGAETVLVTQSALVTGYTPGEALKVRLRVTGVGTTALSAKVWRASATEPAAWQLQASDVTAALQGVGSVGLQHFLSGSATLVPVVLSVDDFVVRVPR